MQQIRPNLSSKENVSINAFLTGTLISLLFSFRCITFHADTDCLFSASHDSFRVHLWEPHKVSDSLLMGWGKIRDIAIASTQMASIVVRSKYKTR